MRKLNKWLRYLIYLFLSFTGLLVILFIYLAMVAIITPPEPGDLSVLNLNRTRLSENCYTIGNNWIRKSDSGLWEMYVEGSPFERGIINGKLSKELVYTQEKAFTDQIKTMIPSSFYINFLKYFIAWFNRDLDKNLTEEEKLEIYGISKSASEEFDYIGSPYQRILNYHAAHDIGHALQKLALVGCSSFATWNGKSQDSTLIAGRNFDFYVGDKFAEDKIVLFVNPDKGHKFMMVTWGGMTGVVSGMNMEGISITINAAPSSMPLGSATPVSILAREILQYAKNIDEALKIAKSRKTFVSESFMIASASDNKAVVIEKTPENIDVYQSETPNQIICTNHYQGSSLSKEESNIREKNKSASVYRYQRIKELLTGSSNSPQKTADILRNQLGLKNKFIGWGNEKAVNQLICHHSIIFEPQKKMVWVSTSPWQLGKYVAYDLNKVFSIHGLKENKEIYNNENTLAPDTFLTTKSFTNFISFRKLKEDLMEGKKINVNSLIQSNPEYYHTYVLAGNYLFSEAKYKEAETTYKLALKKEVATKYEEEAIQKKIQLCISKISQK